MSKAPISADSIAWKNIMAPYLPVMGDDGASEPKEPTAFESLPKEKIDHPKFYNPSDELKAAVNTALLLGMPLLLTGDPGSGKTQLGYSIAYNLGIICRKFETKSTSQARDLFYVYDAVGRFHAEKDADDPVNFITYNALGQAILDTYSKEDVAGLLPPPGRGYEHPPKPRRSVVIVDEVDKATRDFPNDLLNEIDQFYFRVPELGRKGLADLRDRTKEGRGPKHPKLRPIVIFTSNSEKRLPDAFLRRCIYFHISEERDEAKRKEWLSGIIQRRLRGVLADDAAGRQLVAEALDFYLFLRRRNPSRPPGLAELLNWVQALTVWRRSGGKPESEPLWKDTDLVQRTLIALLKNREDSELNSDVAKAWAAERAKSSGPQ